MKTIDRLFIVTFFLAVTACMSTGTGDRGTILYETDFSSDDGSFELRGSEIEEGSLHVNAEDEWTLLTEPLFGDKSDTTLRIKFGDPISVHLNFLVEDKKRLLMHFSEEGINFISFISGEQAGIEGLPVSLVSGRWYEFSISFRDPRVTVHMDSIELGTIVYNGRLPPKGRLAFEAHGEYWIDDLQIVEMRDERGTGDGGTILYETDFSKDDDMFDLGGGDAVNSVENGVLNLKKGPGGEVAWASLGVPFGDDSLTTFRIWFEDPVFAHINFLQREDSRVLMHVKANHIYIGSILNGESVAESGFETIALSPGRWYDFSVSLGRSTLTLTIDGYEIGSVDIDRRLPEKARLSFECHEEYRVDDLRIVEFGVPAGTEEAERLAGVENEEIRRLLFGWEEAVRTRNADRLYELLWPEVTFEFRNRNGRMTKFQGIEAVRRFRLDFLEDPGLMEQYRLPELRFFEDHNEETKSYGFTYENRHIDEWITAARRGGEWKIRHLELILPTPGPWVTNRWQALGDENGDGFLQAEEMGQLFEWTRQFFSGTHSAGNPVDALFDTDGNGSLTAREIRAAGDAIFGRGFRWFSSFNPGWAEGQLDLDGDGELTAEELDLIHRFMTGGGISEDEVGRDRGYFLGNASGIPFPDFVFQPVPREVENYLDELADRNGDGRVEEAEQEVIVASLESSHPVESYLDEALDLHHDGRVNTNDIMLALQVSASGRRILAADSEPPYAVATPLDAYLDADGDGRVDGGEISTAVAFLAGDAPRVKDVSARLKDLADRNGDGEIDRNELENLVSLMTYPHPVNPDEPIDVAGDHNGDSFLEPAELGIAAGISEKGTIPTLEDRVRMLRRTGVAHDTGTEEERSAVSGKIGGTGTEETGFRSEYYERLGKIQDRKLAVISLETQTAGVDEETASGIIVFVENAFVNVGKVRVVERKNIEELLQEYEFQSSALIDENTAIEIGKLSGADIIVIGSINRVGGIFYLNIKLIEVETGEIIGSNIARAKDESEFLDMCTEAVYMLF